MVLISLALSPLRMGEEGSGDTRIHKLCQSGEEITDPAIRLHCLSKLNFCMRKRSLLSLIKKITLSEIRRVRFVQLLAKLQMR